MQLVLVPEVVVTTVVMPVDVDFVSVNVNVVTIVLVSVVSIGLVVVMMMEVLVVTGDAGSVRVRVTMFVVTIVVTTVITLGEVEVIVVNVAFEEEEGGEDIGCGDAVVEQGVVVLLKPRVGSTGLLERVVVPLAKGNKEVLEMVALSVRVQLSHRGVVVARILDVAGTVPLINSVQLLGLSLVTGVCIEVLVTVELRVLVQLSKRDDVVVARTLEVAETVPLNDSVQFLNLDVVTDARRDVVISPETVQLSTGVTGGNVGDALPVPVPVPVTGKLPVAFPTDQVLRIRV